MPWQWRVKRESGHRQWEDEDNRDGGDWERVEVGLCPRGEPEQ